MRDVVSTLFRRKRIVLGIFLPIVFVVTVGTMLKFSIYEASAKVLLQQERFALIHVPNEASQPFITREPGEEVLNSQIELMWSRSLHEAVVRAHRLHLRAPCPALELHDSLTARARVEVCQRWHQLLGKPLVLDADVMPASKLQDRFERALIAFQSALAIVPIKQSKLILIRYRDRDPELAARIVNDLIDRFRSKHLQLNQTAGAYELYRSEAESLRDRLVASEARLQQFREQAGIVDLDRQKRLNLEKMSRFETELRTTEADLAGTQAQIERLQSQLAAQPVRITTERREVQNLSLDKLKASLMQLEVQRSRLREKFTPDAQPLREVESQIQQAKQILAQETATRVQEQSTQRNPNYQSLQAAFLSAEASLSRLQARQDILRQHVKEYFGVNQKLDALGFQMAPLRRDLDLNVQVYTGYLKKEEEARFARALDQHDIVNIKVAEPAHIPIEPVVPRRILNLLLGVFLGMTTAVGCAFVADRSDHSLRTPDDIEQHLGLPLLASVPVQKRWA